MNGKHGDQGEKDKEQKRMKSSPKNVVSYLQDKFQNLFKWVDPVIENNRKQKHCRHRAPLPNSDNTIYKLASQALFVKSLLILREQAIILPEEDIPPPCPLKGFRRTHRFCALPHTL